jgi:hypothetical protein
MHRTGLLRAGLSLGLCLMTGCLYYAAPAPDVQSAVKTIQPPPAEDDPPPPPLAVEPVKRGASSIEPPDLFKLEMGPAPAFPDFTLPAQPSQLAPPPPPDRPLVTLCRGIMEKNPADVEAALKKIDPERRQRMLALLELAAGVGEGGIEDLPPDDAAALLEQLRQVGTTLEKRAPLVLRGVRLCRSIRGFGQFEEAGPAPEYQAGERVQVYAEVRHFRSKPGTSGHETRLSASLEVLDAKGKKVSSLALGTCSDRSRSPRRDYFLNCQFHIPAELGPGEYTLRLTVRDMAGEKTREARSSLRLRVRASGGAADGV